MPSSLGLTRCARDRADRRSRGTFRLDAKAMPLRQVEQAWAELDRTSDRIVLTP
jgi:hypothetical protein